MNSLFSITVVFVWFEPFFVNLKLDNLAEITNVLVCSESCQNWTTNIMVNLNKSWLHLVIEPSKQLHDIIVCFNKRQELKEARILFVQKST